MKRRLFADECELLSLGNITLTTHRVIAYAKHGRGEASTALLLDHVQWTRLASASHSWLTVATTVLGVLTTIAVLGGSFGIGSLMSALFLSTGLLLRRRTAVIIASGTGQIKAWFPGDRDRHRQARSFLDAVDHAAARDWSRSLAAPQARGREQVLASLRESGSNVSRG